MNDQRILNWKNITRLEVSKLYGLVCCKKNRCTGNWNTFDTHREKLLLLDLLGEGGFGQVYVGRHRSTGIERAIKMVEKSPFEDENRYVIKAGIIA